MDRKWYVVQVRPRADHVAASELQRNGFEKMGETVQPSQIGFLGPIGVMSSPHYMDKPLPPRARFTGSCRLGRGSLVRRRLVTGSSAEEPPDRLFPSFEVPGFRSFLLTGPFNEIAG